MDLFSSQPQDQLRGTPLAEILRPQNFAEILGQDEFLSSDSVFKTMIDEDRLPSLILWGPPGCGKTTFARVLATKTKGIFIAVNAVDTGAKAIKEIGAQAEEKRRYYQQKTILFIDEIHRLNRAQQDVLLPFVETGGLTLIGATTENPSIEVNAALLSRCRVIVFKKLSQNDLRQILVKAFKHFDKEMERMLAPEALEKLLQIADGDARRLINFVDQIFEAHKKQETNDKPFHAEALDNILGKAPLYFSRDRDDHYDTISAFIKSIRGSDPDAGLYYLARMVEAGEDPVFIARRLVILASEDIGNADPRALMVAVSGFQAVEKVGFPEAAINLAQVVTYLASSPKSNRSYLGLRKAQEEVRRSRSLAIPLSVRNPVTSLMDDLGYGDGYQYAHDGDRGWLEQQFLPEEIKNKKFYEPSDHGFEKNIKTYLAWIKGETKEPSPKK